MLFLHLLACGAATPAWGTWMFTRQVTLATGDECTNTVSHNFIGAYEPIVAGEDTAWTTGESAEYSPEVFFGRLEATAEEDGAVLILGTDALPGQRQGDGTWLFYWTRTDAGGDTTHHAVGYDYAHTYDSSTTLRISGDFAADAFEGTHETETQRTDTWSESDVWNTDAAVYVGENGEMPVGDWLRVVGQDGLETNAGNARETYDCGESGCTLSVAPACAYRYTLTGVATSFAPDDSRWVEDAGQPSGNP